MRSTICCRRSRWPYSSRIPKPKSQTQARLATGKMSIVVARNRIKVEACPAIPTKLLLGYIDWRFDRRSTSTGATNRKTQVKPIPDLEVTSEAPRPLDWMLAQEQSQHLAQAIAELRPPQREILTLKYTENWSYQEIADHLGVPLRSVEYRLLQARTQLRKLVVNGVTANTKHTSA